MKLKKFCVLLLLFILLSLSCCGTSLTPAEACDEAKSYFNELKRLPAAYSYRSGHPEDNTTLYSDGDTWYSVASTGYGYIKQEELCYQGIYYQRGESVGQKDWGLPREVSDSDPSVFSFFTPYLDPALYGKVEKNKDALVLYLSDEQLEKRLQETLESHKQMAAMMPFPALHDDTIAALERSRFSSAALSIEFENGSPIAIEWSETMETAPVENSDDAAPITQTFFTRLERLAVSEAEIHQIICSAVSELGYINDSFLIEQAEEIWTEWLSRAYSAHEIYDGNLLMDTDRFFIGDRAYFKVVDPRYSSCAELQAVIDCAYTKDGQQNFGIDISKAPLYIDYQGELWKQEADSIRYPSYTNDFIALVSFSDDVMTILVSGDSCSAETEQSSQSNPVLLTFVKGDNNLWLLDRFA